MAVTIGYIILAHQDPHLVARVARLLIRNAGIVSIHYDLSSKPEEFASLKSALGEDAERILWPERVRVAWGEWSIVQATLNAAEALAGSGQAVDFVHLMSGADYPIRPLSAFRDFLAHYSSDFIECADMASETWVKGGLTHERYQYRHYVNWKRRPNLFELSLRTQRLLSPKRSFPKGLRPHLGSQWWTLTWRSLQAVLAAGRDRRLTAFFRAVWIPDEMFIQSVVASVVGAPASTRISTLYQFGDNGMPILYHNDHADYLARQPFFFARKISRQADRLRDALDAQVDGTRPVVPYDQDAFGIRTKEYQSHVRTWAKPSQEVHPLGYEKDHWGGDLAYLRAPIIVVYGASHRELRALGRLLNRTSHILCHGALFHPDRIEFVQDALRFAGYGSDDVALRDNRVSTFLADLINHTRNARTAFLLPWGMDLHIRPRMVWSPHSRNLVVRGNIVRAFEEYIERQARDGRAGSEPKDGDATATEAKGALATGAAFSKFEKEYSDYHDELAAEFSKSDASVCQIDLMSAGWQRELAAFLRQAVPDHPMSPSALFDTLSNESPLRLWVADPARRIPNEFALISEIEDTSRRFAHLRDYANFGSVKPDRPFVAILGASDEELRFVGRVLEHLGVILCHGVLFDRDRIEFRGNVSHHAGYAADDIALRDRDPARFLQSMSRGDGQTDSRAMIGFISPWALDDDAANSFAIWSELSRVLVVRGNVLRAFVKQRGAKAEEHSAKSLATASQVHSFVSRYSKYYADIRAECRAAHAEFYEIDLMCEDWLMELLRFAYVQPVNRIEGAYAFVMQEAERLSDPCALLENPGRVIRAIADERRRLAHLRALERSFSTQRRVPAAEAICDDHEFDRPEMTPPITAEPV